MILLYRYCFSSELLMLNEKIDLYEYFGLARGSANGGYLTTFAVHATSELKPKLRPAMLVLPGGGYMFLSDRENEPIALEYMVKGYSSFVLTYSINAKYPVPLIEACMAIIYIRENAEKYCVDRDHVAAIGFSAGGHLTAMLATISDEKEVKAVLGDKTAKAKPNAVVLSYPVATLGIRTHAGSRDVITGGDPELMERLSPEKRVDKNTVPAFIWHTFEDNCVPVENSLALASAYNKADVPFALHIFERGWHGLSLCNDNVSDQTEKDKALADVGKWFELSVDWLKSRGFEVKVK